MARKKKKVSLPSLLFFMLLIAALLITVSPYFSLPIPSWGELATNAGLIKIVDVDSPETVQYLDVGQGDAILLKSGTSAALIDAGPAASSTKLLAALKSKGIKKIDTLILTHPHEDHIGGAKAVLENLTVGSIFMLKSEHNTKTYLDLLSLISQKNMKITTPKTGDTLKTGNYILTFFAPKQSNEELNNQSVIVKATYLKTAFLFMGDAEMEEESELLKSGFSVKSDVLKIGHHGSKTSTGITLLKAVKPSYAVITAGSNNDYNLPNGTTLSNLRNAGVTLYRTDLNGTVIFATDGNNITVKAEKK